MNVTVTSNINMAPALKKIRSDKFWKYAAQEWKRLMIPYVPRRTGHLMQNVEAKPNEVIYKEPYARYLYNGKVYVDPKYGVSGFTNDGGITWFSRKNVKKVPANRALKIRRDVNPKASAQWDKAAIKDKQDLLLVSSMQKWVDRNL